MLQKIIPALGIVAITLTACAEIDTLTRADRTRAEAQRLSAQASANDAEARLTAAQAISVTLATATRHADRMTDEALSRADRLAALALAGGLSAGVFIGAFVVLLLVLRRYARGDWLRSRRDDAALAGALAEVATRLRHVEAMSCHVAGQLAELRQLPEQRARVRALLQDAQARAKRE